MMLKEVVDHELHIIGALDKKKLDRGPVVLKDLV